MTSFANLAKGADNSVALESFGAPRARCALNATKRLMYPARLGLPCHAKKHGPPRELFQQPAKPPERAC